MHLRSVCFVLSSAARPLLVFACSRFPCSSVVPATSSVAIKQTPFSILDVLDRDNLGMIANFSEGDVSKR